MATATFDAALVPQKSLGAVRFFLAARAEGKDVDGMATVGLEVRAAGYAENAAQTLGFLDEKGDVTDLGRALLATTVGSENERMCFRRALVASKLFVELVPDLLEAEGPSLAELAVRLAQKAGLSQATAKRRAAELLGWRKSLFVPRKPPPPRGTQLRLPMMDEEPAPANDDATEPELGLG